MTPKIPMVVYPLSRRAEPHPEIVEVYQTQVDLLRAGTPFSLYKRNISKHWFEGRGSCLPEHLALEVEVKRPARGPSLTIMHNLYSDRNLAFSGAVFTGDGPRATIHEYANSITICTIPFQHKEVFSSVMEALHEALHFILFSAPSTEGIRHLPNASEVLDTFSREVLNEAREGQSRHWMNSKISAHDKMIAQSFLEEVVSEMENLRSNKPINGQATSSLTNND